MRWAFIILAFGISVCLIGAFVMVAGESIFGEEHAGIATVIGIVGIGLIATSGVSIIDAFSRSQKSKNQLT